MMHWLKSFFTSVFTKLLLVTCATVFVINFSLTGMLWVYKTYITSPFQRNITLYLDYIIADIGAPPTLDKALSVSEKTKIQIHYNGEQGSWTTGTDNSYKEARFHSPKSNPKLKFGGHDDGFVVKYAHPTGEFIFAFDDDDDNKLRETIAHILFFLVPTIILTITYFVTKRILRPLRYLTDGVDQVSSGNLSHTIPVRCKDELGSLASSFNEMTHKLRAMLHTKERLLLDVSHELRSPLTRMKVALEFLPKSDRKSLKEDIHEMEAMITSILDTAKMHHSHSRINLQEIEVVSLLQKVVEQYEGSRPSVSLFTPIPPIIHSLDQEQIKSVLKNIIENGLKYSNSNSAPLQVHLKDDKNNLTISIEDDGEGIHEKELPFIIEPFYRVDKSRSKETGGYGLGLSLCKTIMEAHSGTMEIESWPGIGTTVTLTLPKK